jgi:mono/diheme cytochrome c family protein
MPTRGNRSSNDRLTVWISSAVLLLTAGPSTSTASAQSRFRPAIPKTWNEAELAEWATPVAGLNVRPKHVSAETYYRAPIDNHRTYPVYAADREPAGYWEMLQKVGPKPLIEPERLRTEADWIEAGRRVFDELDHFTMRSYDPNLISRVRAFQATSPDGRLGSARWIPTEKGLAIGLSNCESCHARREASGVRVPGPPVGSAGYGADGPAAVVPLLIAANNVAAAPFILAEPFPMRAYRAFAVPWIEDDIHADFKQMSMEALRPINAPAVAVSNGIFARWNGSPYYPSKIPDLIGVHERKYLDATATHLNRGIGDIMRYAALVSYAESSEFGPHRLTTSEQSQVMGRLPDEGLYALALYIHSLKAPSNPNPFDEKARAGQKLFQSEGCNGCHTPPFYTNNKLTLAEGFTPAKDQPASLDVLPISVGTDPGLALKTRKGTGYYKVPSLKGVWYRGRYLHDGSVASLEEMFDPDRLKDTHRPGGFRPAGVATRAIPGHRFGLSLKPAEREQLIAFLRTL